MGQFQSRSILFLKLVDLLLGVAKILQRARELTLVLGADLGARDGLHQTRGTADKHLDVLLLGLGQHRLEQFLGDVPSVALPVLGGLVQDVEGTESLGVGILELGKLATEKNVFLGHIAENKSNLGLVVGVVEDGSAELVHRGDASAASNERNVVMLVLGPGVLGQRALEVKALTRNEVVDVSAHGAVGIFLDQQINVALLSYIKKSRALACHDCHVGRRWGVSVIPSSLMGV